VEDRTNVTTVLLLAALLAALFSGLAHVGSARRTATTQQGLDGARFALSKRDGRRDSLPVLPDSAPMKFAPGTAAGDRDAILAAVAGARPEARRLVSLVQGLVTVSVTPLRPGIAGSTQATVGGYDMKLDLGRISHEYGPRGIARVTLHEFGHVVDGALVPSDMEQSLDAKIPRGWGCDDGGRSGACADRAERFAESFAKWATGDIGADIYLGYRVPPPAPLDSWGAPLAALR
jgi:hypothetical protein